MNRDAVTLVFALIGGLLSIAGGLFNWDWFMNNYRARFFVWLFGRTGARIAYVMLGIFLIALGFYVQRF
jgi:hypothetical protein